MVVSVLYGRAGQGDIDRDRPFTAGRGQPESWRKKQKPDGTISITMMVCPIRTIADGQIKKKDSRCKPVAEVGPRAVTYHEM